MHCLQVTTVLQFKGICLQLKLSPKPRRHSITTSLLTSMPECAIANHFSELTNTTGSYNHRITAIGARFVNNPNTEHLIFSNLQKHKL